MNDIVLDTNPLVYIYLGVSEIGGKYAELLGDLSKNNQLYIPKIVYGELSLIFDNAKELDAFINDTGIIVGDASAQTYITAAKRWAIYNKRRVLLCNACGEKIGQLECKKCGSEINIRQHILSDFIIGSYAFHMSGKSIVTSDKGYFSTYFPELTIISIKNIA